MGWGNIYRRRLRVFRVALIIYLDYKMVQKRGQWVNEGKRTTLWEKAHERNAKRLLSLIIDLEGLWVKFGQYLSTRADVLPEAYICLLKQLQDSLPPRPLQEICSTIEEELGKSMDSLFSDFVDVPLATASIAQVHRATLENGKEVVVKVRHKGIKEVILEDLKNAKTVVDWIAWAEPQYDFNPLIDEWCKEAPKELDFNREAENTRLVSENLSKSKEDPNPQNHVDVLIPEVIMSSEKVLILEYMDGYRLNDYEVLESSGVDKQKIVEEITRAYAHQIYVDGFFNGDPHPGNFLVSREAPHRPILLDFGLTKSISISMKQALAKMFLACAEGDHVALLSAFTEMGLRLRLDMPDQAMEVTNVFFRSSAPAKEAYENMRFLDDHRKKSMKAIQEKTKLANKEFARFNPVDAFPGDAVIFMRVLNLLRGLSSLLNVRVVYLDIMRPFAEAALYGSIKPRSGMEPQWIYNSPVLSNVETKLRQLLLEIGNEKILGIQVCVYKDGKVLIDTAAGILGKYDPRPVQPDTLFPVFSVTKGITAGMLHTLVDAGKLKLEENVANIWLGFGANGKDQIRVHHLLNHVSGLHNALADISRENPFFMCEWDECLNLIANSAPETEPGSQQLYHYLSFGWLCGGVIEHASGKRFQEVLEEAIIYPLKVEGELYIGVPPGVESRLATLTLDDEDLKILSKISEQLQDLPSTFRGSNFAEFVAVLPVLYNTLAVRRAIIPAANGHCSARALARYYAALADGGKIPPPHVHSEPPLGTHSHIPKFPSPLPNKRKGSKSKEVDAQMDNTVNSCNLSDQIKKVKDIKSRQQNSMCDTSNAPADISRISRDRIFSNPRIHQAILGVDEYENMVLPRGKFGLGFRRLSCNDGSLIGFGHSGIGGSTGFCNIEHRFAMAVTVNKMSLGTVTRKIVQLVCSELNLPVPDEFTSAGLSGMDIQPNIENALIN